MSRLHSLLNDARQEKGPLRAAALGDLAQEEIPFNSRREGLEVIRAALNDDDPRVVVGGICAIKALGEHAQILVPLLFSHVIDPEFEIADAAAGALRNLTWGAEEATASFRRCLESDGRSAFHLCNLVRFSSSHDLFADILIDAVGRGSTVCFQVLETLVDLCPVSRTDDIAEALAEYGCNQTDLISRRVVFGALTRLQRPPDKYFPKFAACFAREEAIDQSTDRSEGELAALKAELARRSGASDPNTLNAKLAMHGPRQFAEAALEEGAYPSAVCRILKAVLRNGRSFDAERRREATDAVNTMLRSGDPEHQEAALRLVAELGPLASQFRGRVEPLMQSDSPFVRAAARSANATLNDYR